MPNSLTTTFRCLVAASLLLAGVAAAQAQVSGGAGITISAELLTDPGEAALAIQLAVDTHTVDLMGFDLAAAATLRSGDGSPIPGAFTYEPESDSSHHRLGVLRFVPAAAGALVALPLELVIDGVGVPERVLRLEAQSSAADPPAEAPTAATPDAATRSAPSTAESRAMYVPVIADGAVAAIDTTTFDLAWTLVVSQGTDDRSPESAMGIALSPDGRTLFTGDAATRELVVVDTVRRAIVARLPLAHGIHAIDLAPDGRSLWVDGALEGYPWLSATTVIDTASLEVVRRLAPALGSAAHLSFTPDGREVWAPSISTNLLWVWDAASGEVLDAVPLTSTALAGDSPEAEQGLIGFNEIALAPDGRTAYAVGPEASVVYAVDVANRQVIGTAQAGARAHGIAVRPDGREVWTANRSGSVTVFDAATLAVLGTIDLDSYANHVSFTRDGAHALISRDTDVAVIDVADRTLVHVIAVGNAPHEFSAEAALPARDAAAIGD